MRSITTLSIVAVAAASFGAVQTAHAQCAEEMTRVQLASTNVAPDLRSRLQPLLRDAGAKIRQGDGAGCDADMRQALQLLKLPVLAPLALSTPVAGATQTAAATRNPSGAAPAPNPNQANVAQTPAGGMATQAPYGAPSAGTGPASHASAASGEGAAGPTAGSGHPAAQMAEASAPSGGNAQHGAGLAQGQCGPCHSFQQGGGTRVGPDLFGVTQHNIASTPGFDYSPALKAHQGQRWSAAALDAFLKAPSSFAPGTRMAFGGVASDADRSDVIAYLQSLNPSAATGASK